MRNGLLGAVVVAVSLAATPPTGAAADQPIERGRYLVNLGVAWIATPLAIFSASPTWPCTLAGLMSALKFPGWACS